MAHFLTLIFLVALLCSVQAHSQHLAIISKFSATSAEGSWLWGWVWGVESSVSVVDRSPPVTFHSRPASFGPQLKDPLLGYVIPLSSFTVSCPTNDTSIKAELPNYGCSPLCPFGDRHPDPTEPWIALVQRGQCPFVDKVRQSQRLGARAAVVGGEDPDVSGVSDTLVSMYSKEDASDVTIPSTYIRYADYKELIVLIRSSTTSHAGLKTLSLLIAAEYSAWEWPILTFVIILFLPSCLTFVTLLVHRVRMARAAQRDRAPEHLVKSLPWRVWNGTTWEKHEGTVPHLSTVSSSTMDLESGTSQSASSHEVPEDTHIPWYETQIECAICISEFTKGDRVRELPCHHIFHIDEIDNWLINLKKFCPVCKADVTQPWNTCKLPGPPVAAMEGEEVVDPISPTEHTPLLSTRGQVGSS